MPQITAGGPAVPIVGNGLTVITSQPLFDLTQSWNDAAVTFTGLKANFTSTASGVNSLIADLQVGGASMFKIRKDGTTTLAASLVSNANISVVGSGNIGWSGSTQLNSNGGNGTLRISNSAGTNTVDMTVGAANILSVNGAFVAAGASLAGSAAWMGFAARTLFDSPSDGVLRISNNAQTDFSRLQFGLTTAAAPALKRSGASLQVVKADDSGFAELYVLDLAIGVNGFLDTTGDGVFRLKNSASTNSVTLTVGAANALAVNGALTAPYLKTTATTVAALTAAATAGAGARSFVTDATQTMTAGIGAVVAGGGANGVPVYSDGAAWRIG